ncbi:50S ribosomal protein L27 [Striga asiatica]|uniref:50S ribosomal protein L27 n=1 Tax=Striga asiatica TaxID=4170 RepID=A0A5A7PZD1_STRAF|nr:50S ribosomal protein L27 [Striga asiatica]
MPSRDRYPGLGNSFYGSDNQIPSLTHWIAQLPVLDPKKESHICLGNRPQITNPRFITRELTRDFPMMDHKQGTPNSTRARTSQGQRLQREKFHLPRVSSLETILRQRVSQLGD